MGQSRTKEKEYGCVDEVEREFLPKYHKSKLQGRRLGNGRESFGASLATEVLRDIGKHLNAS